ncbi:MAG: hypothetical protein JSR34_05165 [Proteobacteria bacterium]|nr:hypothetical protein [Pseudomonadota bacterium]
MKIASLAVASTLAIAMTFGSTVPNVARASDDKPCNTGGAAVGGAVLGALLGGKHHRAEGAVVGGAVGAIACMAINYHAKQVKTAQQAAQDYQNANGGNLPEHAEVVAYQTRLDPAGAVHPGVESNLVSDIEVTQGSDGVQPTVEQEFSLVDPDGKTQKTFRKPASQGASAGAFQTSVALNLPKGVKEGMYQFKTSLYVNGQDVRDTQVPMQVVAASM